MLLLIDNYDSFTWNLVHGLGALGAESRVVRNDAMSAAEALALGPGHVVISPGPGTPDQAGMSLEIVRAAAGRGLPLLGVCLGHQALGQAFGGRVIRAPAPIHGKVESVHHTGAGVFAGLPSPFEATRYHSLILERASLPGCFEITAQSGDGLIMGIAHRDVPLEGVQFHPESIASREGTALFANFLAARPALEAAPA